MTSDLLAGLWPQVVQDLMCYSFDRTGCDWGAVAVDTTLRAISCQWVISLIISLVISPFTTTVPFELTVANVAGDGFWSPPCTKAILIYLS